jgi:drug/metabolite transporter (DMT)-like permease
MSLPAAPSTPATLRPPLADATRGLLLGAVGVLIFAATLPMTRLAVGDASAPQLPPAFVTAGRAGVAGLLSVGWLLMLRAPFPARRHWRACSVSALGTVVGFPLFLALALRRVDAMHAAVVTGVLPLATAAVAALVLAPAPVGRLLGLRGGSARTGHRFRGLAGQRRPVGGRRLLLLAVLCGAIGYVGGAQVSASLPAQQVICWVLVLSLPLTLPAMWWLQPQQPASAAAWVGFAYVSLFSMWLGFFAWYRGLALGGVMRVSQVQLLQPFLALLFAVPILGERLDPARWALRWR